VPAKQLQINNNMKRRWCNGVNSAKFWLPPLATSATDPLAVNGPPKDAVEEPCPIRGPQRAARQTIDQGRPGYPLAIRSKTFQLPRLIT